METEFKNQCYDKFEDIPIGEVFMSNCDKIYIKICPIFKDGFYINAISLKDGSYLSFTDNAEVKWLKNAKLVMNE